MGRYLEAGKIKEKTMGEKNKEKSPKKAPGLTLVQVKKMRKQKPRLLSKKIKNVPRPHEFLVGTVLFFHRVLPPFFFGGKYPAYCLKKKKDLTHGYKTQNLVFELEGG